MTESWKESVGNMSDRAVSKRFGVGSSTVRRYRLQHHIPAHNPRDVVTPQELLEKLPTCTDYQLVKEFNISATRIEAYRAEVGIPEPRVQRPRFVPLEDGVWTEETIALLGTMPDPELADLLGVSRTPVKKKRKELGVAAYQKSFPELTADLVAEFGKVSDSTLANRLGVSASFIRRARLKWLKSD